MEKNGHTVSFLMLVSEYREILVWETGKLFNENFKTRF